MKQEVETAVLTIRIPKVLKDGLHREEKKSGIPKQRILSELIQNHLIDQNILKFKMELSLDEIYPDRKIGIDEKNRILKKCTMPIKKGMTRHHWNYDEKYVNDIIYIKAEKHIVIHGSLKLDYKTKKYRDYWGNLLNTKREHLRYLARVDKQRKEYMSQRVKKN